MKSVRENILKHKWPLQEISAFKLDDNDNRLWRYMGIDKFLALLSTSKIHFTRIDQFEDNWEGAMPASTQEEFKSFINAMKSIIHNRDRGRDRNLFENYEQIMRKNKFLLFASCWHCNEFESAAMWRLYGQYDSNVAIVTSKDKMYSCLSWPNGTFMSIGKVKYINYKIAGFNFNNLLKYTYHKRKSFEHENEIRLVFNNLDYFKQAFESENIEFESVLKNVPLGIDIDVNLHDFLECVKVSPAAPEWYVNVIKNICAQYGVSEKIVHKSDLYNDPIM